MNQLKFYVYAYLRSKDSTFGKAGTPYYIGKGSGNRAFSLNHGKVPVPKEKRNIVFLERNLTEVGSLSIERRMIYWYGRKDIQSGILLNRTYGGDGSGVSLETKEKLRKINLGKIASKETREKMSAAGKLRKDSQETKDKKKQSAIKNKNGERFQSIEACTKRIESLRLRGGANLGNTHTKESNEKNRIAHLGKKTSEETKSKMRGYRGKQEVLNCPHCDFVGGKSPAKRHHFEKCKFRKERSPE